jgi:hypothetical protein
MAKDDEDKQTQAAEEHKALKRKNVRPPSRVRKLRQQTKKSSVDLSIYMPESERPLNVRKENRAAQLTFPAAVSVSISFSHSIDVSFLQYLKLFFTLP